MFFMLRGTLTTEEWKTEQQLFVEAVSVNLSEKLSASLARIARTIE